MTDLIELAKGKLNDPILMEWALDRYRDTEKVNKQLREAMEQTWFDDLTLRRWLDNDDHDILTRLFSQLPALRFANLGPAIGERWDRWKGSLASLSAPVLAQYDPALAWKCFAEPRNGHHPDADTVHGIIRALTLLPEDDARTLLRAISEQLLKSKDNFMRDFLLGDLLSVALSFDKELALEITRSQLQHAKDEQASVNVLKRLSRGLAGSSIYQQLAADIRSGVSAQRFEALAPLFNADVPLGQLDHWSREQASFTDFTTYVDALPNPEDRHLIQACVEIVKAKGGSQYRDAAANFLIGLIAAGQERDEIDVSGLGLQETVDLLASDLSEIHHFDPLLEHLSNFSKDDVADCLTETLEREKATYGSIHMAETMGRLRWDELIPPLMASLCDECGDLLCESARDALALIGPVAQEHLIRNWDGLDNSQKIYGLSVIVATGGDAASSFALDRYDEFMGDDPEYWCRLASAAPDKSLLTLLESQLPRQQALFDEVFYPLARLFEVDHPLLETARERILERKAEQKERAAAFERGDWFHSSLKLSLRCPECGDTNEYQVRKIAVNPADPDANMLLAQEFACTSCGTWPNFEFTGDARMTITAELLKLAADSDAGLAGKSDVLIRFDAPLKGRIVPVGEAVSYAHAALDKDPRAVAQWLRLGFCYQQILSRPRHALKYAEQALSLELNAVEAILQKADALTLRGEDESAFALLDNALGSKDHWRFFLADIATPAEFAAQFAELYNELLRRLGKTDRPNLLSSFLGVSKKVGRNDACPCGSGKKYKKCCLANQ